VKGKVVWDRHAVYAGLKTVGECRPLLLTELRDMLNRYHGTGHSVRYWDVLAGMWLEQFMHVCYAAWMEACASDTDTDVSALSVPVLDHLVTPLEFSNRVAGGEDLVDNLVTAMKRFVLCARPIARLSKNESGIIKGEVRPGGIRHAVRMVLFRFVFSRTPRVVICAPYFQCSQREWMTVLWKWRDWACMDGFEEAPVVPFEYDNEWRNNESERKDDLSGFAGALSFLLPLCVPAVFLEGYERFRAEALALREHRPAIAYTANALHYNMLFKLCAAEWSERGTVLLSHQHGGGYGLDRIHAIEDFETRVTDRFYSWGWSRDDRQVKPMSIGVYRPRVKRNHRQILLNCIDFPKAVYRLHFHPMPGTMETMISETIDFLEAFPDHNDFLIRPYATDYGWGLVQRIMAAAPRARYDHGSKHRNIYMSYAESGLVVHNYLGTSWLQTLGLNIPTICFYDRETYEFRDEARPYIERLESVGILHRTGRAAAAFIRDRQGNVGDWWMNDAVQEARGAFCSRYTRYSDHWAEDWEKEFKEILAASGDGAKPVGTDKSNERSTIRRMI
jgi:putative transferase (TIGR04331 family)